MWITQTLIILGFTIAVWGLLALVGKIGHWLNLEGEVTRKIVHSLLGITTLSFPFLFDRNLPVWIIAGSVTLVLWWVRLSKSKKSTSNALYRIERNSVGELCYPLAIALTFTLSGGDVVFYTIPVLVLALADATGALIGVRYGLNQYWTDEGKKSLEGSFAVGITTFFCVHVILLVSETVGGVESLLIALIISFMVVGMEAVSTRGLDNLYLPLFTWILLIYNHDIPKATLLNFTGFLGFLISGSLVWKKVSKISSLETVGTIMFLYCAWAHGKWSYIAPPLLFLAANTALSQSPQENDTRRMGRLISSLGIGLIWIMLDLTGIAETRFKYSFAFSFALQIGFLVSTTDRLNINSILRFALTILSILWVAGIVFPLYENPDSYSFLTIALLVLFLSTAAISGLRVLTKSSFLKHQPDRLLLIRFLICLLFSPVDSLLNLF